MSVAFAIAEHRSIESDAMNLFVSTGCTTLAKEFPMKSRNNKKNCRMLFSLWTLLATHIAKKLQHTRFQLAADAAAAHTAQSDLPRNTKSSEWKILNEKNREKNDRNGVAKRKKIIMHACKWMSNNAKLESVFPFVCVGAHGRVCVCVYLVYIPNALQFTTQYSLTSAMQQRNFAKQKKMRERWQANEKK